MVTAKFTKLRYVFILLCCLVSISSCASMTLATSGSIVGSVIYSDYDKKCTLSEIDTIYFSNPWPSEQEYLTKEEQVERYGLEIGAIIDLVGITPYIAYTDLTLTGAAKALAYFMGTVSFIYSHGNQYMARKFKRPYGNSYRPESGEWFQSNNKICKNEGEFFVIIAKQKTNFSQKELTSETCEKIIKENFPSIIGKYSKQLIYPIHEKKLFQCWFYHDSKPKKKQYYLQAGILLHAPKPKIIDKHGKSR